MVTLLLETLPHHKTREYMRKMSTITGLSVDTVKATDFLRKLNSHDC